MTDDIEPTAPPEIGGKAAEYVEKLVSESFKRELDQEENVVRSLPFFATSIGVLMTLVGFARSALPALSWEVWSVLAYGFLAVILISLGLVLWFLYCVVRKRSFDCPMYESELLKYATDLTASYRSLLSERPLVGHESRESRIRIVECRVINDIRIEMIRQFSISSESFRRNTQARLKARVRAFSALMMALVFALALIVAILGNDAWKGGTSEQGTHLGYGAGPLPQRGPRARTKADAAGNAPNCQGTLDLRRGPPLGQERGQSKTGW